MARLDPHSYADSDQPQTKSLRLKLDVDFDSHRLSGECTLMFGSEVSGPLDLDTRALTLHGARNQTGTEVPYEWADPDPILGQRLRLTLPPGTEAVTLAYETSPEASALQWLTPAQTAGRAKPFLFSQCQAIHARSLAPLQDSPRVRVPYEAQLTVPEDLAAVMSAGLQGQHPGPAKGRRTFVFRMPQAIPPYLLALAVGNLDSRDLSPRSRVYAEPETVEAAAWEFAELEKMIATAEGLFGPYEWDRYDLLTLPPAFPYGGMENPRITFLTPTLLAGDRSLVAVVAHELAHSWTGNLVTNASADHFWLNEGFTVWAERRILEAVYGPDYAAMGWALGLKDLNDALERFGKDSPLTRLLTDLGGVDPDEVYSEVPYEKGARFVALLERTAGRQRFDRFIRDYMDAFRFTSITSEEFLAFLEEKLPGLSSQVNAQAWIYGLGLPDNAPTFPCPALDRIQALAGGWDRGERPDAATIARWNATEKLLYLQNLARPKTAEECLWLDKAMGLTGQGNYEILVEWLCIAAASDYEPAFERIRQVLTRVGRMKYLRPLYAALGGHVRTRLLAREIFDSARDQYHPISRRVIASVMESYPKG